MKRLFLAVSIVFASLNTSHAITHTLSGPIDPFQAPYKPGQHRQWNWDHVGRLRRHLKYT